MIHSHIMQWSENWVLQIQRQNFCTSKSKIMVFLYHQYTWIFRCGLSDLGPGLVFFKAPWKTGTRGHEDCRLGRLSYKDEPMYIYIYVSKWEHVTNEKGVTKNTMLDTSQIKMRSIGVRHDYLDKQHTSTIATWSHMSWLCWGVVYQPSNGNISQESTGQKIMATWFSIQFRRPNVSRL